VYDKLFALNSQTVGVMSKRIVTHGVLLTKELDSSITLWRRNASPGRIAR
jgi:hypothetical protein